MLSRLSLFLVMLISSALSAQTTRYVPSVTYPTIQSAVNASVDGDIVELAAGTYNEEVSILGKGLQLRGQGSNNTIIDGQSLQRCVIADLPTGSLLKLVDLALVNGQTQGTTLQEQEHEGGCIYVADALTALSAGVVELNHCLIAGGRAANGGGVYSGRHHQLLMSFTTVMNCGPGATYAAALSLPSGFGLLGRGDMTITDCLFSGNTAGLAANGAGSGGAIRIESTSSQGGFLLDCKRTDFMGNVALRGGAISAVAQMGVGATPGNVKLENCQVIGNGSTAANSRGAALELSWTDFWSRSSLFARNACVTGPDLVDGARRLEFVHCTITGNTPLAALPSTTVFDLCTYTTFANIRNCIIAKNRATNFLKGLGGASPPTVVTSLIEGPVAVGLPSLDLGFVDALNDDYRLMPLSPAVDVGTTVYGAGVDLDGLARNVGTAPDAGCFENQTTGVAPGMIGTVTDLMNAPFDCLLVNSSTGNGRRNLHLVPGSALTIEVLQPPTSVLPANFLLWGRIGVPSPSEAFNIFFAGGQMAFAPAIVAPGNPLLFTLTNSYEPPPVSGIVASSPTPWAVSGFALPFPATMTIQGLIETGGGDVRITNAIVVSGY